MEFLVDKLTLEQVYLQEIRPHCYYSSTILSFSYLERGPFVMKVQRVKGEGRQSELRCKLFVLEPKCKLFRLRHIFVIHPPAKLYNLGN